MKVSQVYNRFWLARQSFGAVGGYLNAAAQLMTIYAAESQRSGHVSAADRGRLCDELCRWMTVYPYALTMQLLDLEKLPEEAAKLLDRKEVALLESTKKPRKFVLMKLQLIVSAFKLETEKYLSVQQLLQSAEAGCSTCRRIKFTPLPFGLTNICTGTLDSLIPGVALHDRS